MKKFVKVLTVLSLALMIAGPLSAGDEKGKKKKGKKPAAANLGAQIMKRLEKAELSEDQIAKINALSAEYSPKVAEARKSARLTKEQAQARRDATAKAKADGKKGKDLKAAADAAASLTAEQKEALAAAASIQKEFNTAVQGLLSDDQRAKAGIGKKKGAKKPKKKKEAA